MFIVEHKFFLLENQNIFAHGLALCNQKVEWGYETIEDVMFTLIILNMITTTLKYYLKYKEVTARHP